MIMEYKIALIIGATDGNGKATGSQVLSIIGLNRVRPDFDDLTMQKGFSG